MLRIWTVIVLLCVPAVIILFTGRPLVVEDPAHRSPMYWRRQGAVFLLLLALLVGVSWLVTL
ncbi:hypothetical protein ACIB24_08410 [Spongisporangium articulatum]|uniref:Uncharacterized protein n=1 Tax=Spongisporangium articulatum TaxID=3362603 RepID=A0ABW8AL31_9ACTN